jgi:hypothetical protein
MVSSVVDHRAGTVHGQVLVNPRVPIPESVKSHAAGYAEAFFTGEYRQGWQGSAVTGIEGQQLMWAVLRHTVGMPAWLLLCHRHSPLDQPCNDTGL